jgi:uncharacterized membrane protein
MVYRIAVRSPPPYVRSTVTRNSQAPQVLYAIGLIGLGILALVYGNFAEIGQTVPQSIPGRIGFVYASGILMVLCGVGLLFSRTTALSIRIVLPYLIVGFLVQSPTLVLPPRIEVNWESIAEVAAITSGAWILFATRSGFGDGSRWAFATGEKGLRIARVLFGLALLPIGLSHFAYYDNTFGLVPAGMPFRAGWVYLTGLGHIAAGLGVLFSVVPRLAATLEAGMLGVFTTVVWIPRLAAAPTSRDLWLEFVVSWTIASSAWLVAASFAKKSQTA